MLHIKELGQDNDQLKNSKLQNYRLWNQPTSNVTALDLLVYVKSMEIDGLEEEAVRDVEELQRISIMALLEGKINDAPYLAYAGKRVDMTMGDFTIAIKYSNLTPARKKALLFCIETGIKPEDAIVLTWKQALKSHFSPLARAIVDSMPRSMNVNYVFWEEMEAYSMSAPLVGLTENFQTTFSGMTFKEVCAFFREAVMIDSNEETIEFVSAILKTVNSAK